MSNVLPSQIPGSSPTGSIIEIPTDQQSFDSKDVVTLNSTSIHQDSSDLFEVSQTEYLLSQKTNAGVDDDNLGDTQYNELRSAQTPPPSDSQEIRSSPLVGSPERDHVCKVRTPQRRTNDSNPSVQKTSFCMISPIRVHSLSPKRKNVLIAQESYSIPNLMSSPASRDDDSSSPSTPSIYLTARQNASPSIGERVRTTTEVTFQGQLDPVANSSSPASGDFSTRIINRKRLRSDDVPDTSDDDEDISIIEITRTVKRNKSVLQVPSSQNVSQKSSPLLPRGLCIPRTSNSSPLKHTLGAIEDLSDKEEDNDICDDDELMQMSMDHLRQTIMRYGLKPSKSKLSMVNSIRRVTRYLSQDSVHQLSMSQDIVLSQKVVRRDIFKVVNSVIRQDEKIWEKIYTFEPVSPDSILTLLRDNDIEISPELFKEWCDYNSISLLDAGDNVDSDLIP